MELNKYIEHTLLKQDASRADLIKLLDEAKENNFLGVCVNPINVKFSKQYLKDTDIKVVTVIGFPLGQTTCESKVLETIDAVKNHGLFDKLLISSFDPAILVVCKKIDKNCKTGILYAPDKLIGMKIAPRPVAFAKEIGADALHPYYMLVTRLYVERAHRAGLQVNPWTVNKESVAKKLIKYGVDGLITDDSALMNTLLGK